MPTSVKELLSSVQIDVNDLSHVRLQLGEYMTILNETANEIARYTQIWIGRYIAMPRKTGEIWAADTAYNPGDIIIDSGNYYYCLLHHTNFQPPNATYWQQITAWDAATTYAIGDKVYHGDGPIFYNAIVININAEPANAQIWQFMSAYLQNEYKILIPYTDRDGNRISPFQFIRLVKGNWANGFSELTEYSTQSVARDSVRNQPFRVNYEQILSSGFSTQLTNDLGIPGTVDGGIILNFSTPLSYDEYIIADFIQHVPFKMVKWNQTPDISIPEWMADAMHWGMTWRAQERFVQAGDNNAIHAADRASRLYKGASPDTKMGGYLREAMGYARNYKDHSSSIIAKPLNWLSRSEERGL